MQRDRGPSYSLGFGVREYPPDEKEERSPDPEGSFIAKSLHGNPIMKFAAVSAATMVSMHFAGKLLKKGGTKLLTTLGEQARTGRETGEQLGPWQTQLFQGFRRTQATLDEWQGLHRYQPDPFNPALDKTDTVAGWHFTKEAAEQARASGVAADRASILGISTDDWIDKNIPAWTLRDTLQQSFVKQARRLPYELPAAYLAQRTLIDPIFGDNPDLERGKWYNPVDMVSDFSKESVKNVLGMLIPIEGGAKAAQQGFRRVRFAKDTITIPRTPYERKLKDVSITLDSSLRQVGHHVADVLDSALRVSSKTTGSLAAGINEAVDHNRSIVEHLHDVRGQSRTQKVTPRLLFDYAKKNIFNVNAGPFVGAGPFVRGAKDYWQGFDKPLDLAALYPSPGVKSELKGGVWSIRQAYRSGAIDQSQVPAEIWEQAKDTVRGLGYGDSAIERLTSSISHLAGVNFSRGGNFRQGAFHQGEMHADYGRLLRERLVSAGVSEDAAERFTRIAHIENLPHGGEKSKVPFLGRRISFGEGVIEGKTEGDWLDNLQARIKVLGTDEAQKIRTALPTALRAADETFASPSHLNALEQRTRQQWGAYYDKGATELGRKTLGHTLDPREFGQGISPANFKFLKRKTAAQLGIPVTREMDDSVVEEALRQRGLDPTNQFQLRAYLTEQKAFGPEFNILGLRPLTVERAGSLKYFNPALWGTRNDFLKAMKDTDPLHGKLSNVPVGKGVYETSRGRILDLTPVVRGAKKTYQILSEQFQVPLIHLSPLNILGANARRSLADKQIIEYTPSGSHQPFLGGEEGGGPIFWQRQKRSKGHLIQLRSNVLQVPGAEPLVSTVDLHQLPGTYRPLPTDKSSMPGRMARIFSGDIGEHADVEQQGWRKLLGVSSNQRESLGGLIKRFRNRKDDLSNPVIMARRLLAAESDDALFSSPGFADGIAKFERYLQGFAMPPKVIAQLEAKFPADSSIGKMLYYRDRANVSHSISALRSPEEMANVGSMFVREDVETILTNKDMQRMLSSKQNALKERFLKNVGISGYFEQSSGQSLRSTGINTRLDEFRNELYRYQATKAALIDADKSGVPNISSRIRDLLDELDELQTLGKIGPDDLDEARAAALGMQTNLLSLGSYDPFISQQQQLETIGASLSRDAKSTTGTLRPALEAIANGQVGTKGSLPWSRATRGFMKRNLSVGDYDYPGTEYNPFGGSTAYAPTVGTVFRERSKIGAIKGALGFSKKPEDFSPSAMAPGHFAYRLNRYFQTFGLGLDEEKYSPMGFIGKGLVGQRVLPIVAGGTTVMAVDRTLGAAVSPEDEDGEEQYRPLVTGKLARLVVGAQSLVSGLVPGGDTYKEKKEELLHGEVPVRRGRYWFLGNCIVPFQEIQIGYGQYTEAQNVSIGDYVITHEGVLKPVLDVVTREMKEGEWTPELKLHTVPFTNTTTDNHPYFAVKKKRCPHGKTFVDCRPDRKSVAVCDRKLYRACEDRYDWAPEWIQAGDLELGDYIAYPRIKISPEYITIGGLPADRDTGFLLGLYMAEGTIHQPNKEKTYGLEFALHKKESRIFARLAELFYSLFDVEMVTRDTSENGRKARFFSVVAGEWFRSILYQTENGDKGFIKDIYKYPKEFILGVLSGLFDGDAGFESRKIFLTSHRLEYILQTRNLLFTLGIESSVFPHDNLIDWEDGRGPIQYEGWRLSVTGDAAARLALLLEPTECDEVVDQNVTPSASKYTVIDDEFVYIKIKSISDNGYRGLVYDFEVQDSHSFCSISAIMHNTPWEGGRVQYFRPSWYRRFMAGSKYTDQDQGSPLESLAFYKDFSPLRPFDPYRYERKHKEDRPYPVTGEYFTGPWGPMTSALNLTAGRILKPSKLMHKEEVQRKLSQYERRGEYGVAPPVERRMEYEPEFAAQPGYGVPQRGAVPLGNGQAQLGYAPPGNGQGGGYGIGPSGALPSRPSPVGGGGSGYIGGSGRGPGRSASITNDTTNLINSAYVENSAPVERSSGLGERIGNAIRGRITRKKESSTGYYNPYESRGLSNPYAYARQARPFQPRVIADAKVMNPGSLRFQAGNLGYELQELSGIYGFAFGSAREALGLGSQDFTPKRPVLQSAGRAYGSERSFWDQNLGGFGDISNPMSEGQNSNLEVSEIIRRFVPHRRRDTQELNPISNRMSEDHKWLPGAENFINFKQGDPYVAIPSGEERLPGKAYERLHKLNSDAYGRYGLVDQHAILGDVAPWSSQYKSINRTIDKQWMTPERKAVVENTRSKVEKMKQRYEFSPYKYAKQNFQEQKMTIKGGVANRPDMFVTEELGAEHPIRLAGVRSRRGSDAAAFMHKYVQAGDRVQATFDADRYPRYSGRERALDVVLRNNGRNVNRALLESEYGQKADEEHPLDTTITEGAVSRAMKSFGEKLAHRNTFLNKKFLPDRTPTEDWERDNVYGATFAQWQCLDMDTEVLTNIGWKLHKDLTNELLLWTLNPETGLGEWSQIDAINIYDYSGEMYYFSGRTVNAKVTPNHRWLTTSQWQQYDKFGFKETTELNSGDCIPRGRPARDVANEVYSDAFVKLIGWIVTEGCFVKGRYKQNQIDISQSRTKNYDKCLIIEDTLRDLQCHWSLYQDPDGENTYKISGEFGLSIRELIPDKIITLDFIDKLSVRQKRLLIEAMVLGDGSSHGEEAGSRYSTFRFEEAERVAILLAQAGIAFSHKEYEWIDHVLPNGSIHPYCLEYRFELHQNNYWRRDKHEPTVEYYEGTVWCPSSENNTIFIRREGLTCWTGNSPYRDFLKPMLYKAVDRNAITSALVLGTIGRMFFRSKNSKIPGGLAGASLGFGIGMFTSKEKHDTGERFIPFSRKKELAVEENADILNYVKYAKLYTRARQSSIANEGVDPEELAQKREAGVKNTRRAWLENMRHIPISSRQKEPSSSIFVPRPAMNGSSLDEAGYYRKQMKRTMYGADPFGPAEDLIAAVPKRKRDHFAVMMNSPISERSRVLSTAGRLERRLLQARWGGKVEKRPDLNEYFSKHELPEEDWQGWSPQEDDMEKVKIKVAQSQGLDASQMGYFPQQVREANLVNPSYPSFRKSQSKQDVSQQLRRLLRQQGISGDVRQIRAGPPGTRVELHAGVG